MVSKANKEKKIIKQKEERNYYDFELEYGTDLDGYLEKLVDVKIELHEKYENIVKILIEHETDRGYYDDVDHKFVFEVHRIETDAEYEARLEKLEKQRKSAAKARAIKRKNDAVAEQAQLLKLAKKYPELLK